MRHRHLKTVFSHLNGRKNTLLPISLQYFVYISIDTAGGVSRTTWLAGIPSLINCNIMLFIFSTYCSTVSPRESTLSKTESFDPSNTVTATMLPFGLLSHLSILGRINLLNADVYPLNPRFTTSHFLSIK